MELPCASRWDVRHTLWKAPSGSSSVRLTCFCSHSSRRRHLSVVTASKGRQNNFSLGDQLLDYIEGGPKLRKWYGAPDQILRDGGDIESSESTNEGSEPIDEIRDAVLVTDADSMTGQLVLLALIVRRVRIRALVRDGKEIVQAFGSYVEVGALADKEVVRGVEHIVFLSQFAAYSNAGVLAALLNGNARRQAEEDESAIIALGIPCTIIRCASLRDEPGGQKGFEFKKGCARKGAISREDAALVCVEALSFPPKEVLIFEVASGDDLVDDWGAVFNSLTRTAV
ncbi:hypothetical protein KP509_20G008300 [Ceratopteris richardii]|uniref:NAD(P)-binding domain-containing protein n=1 Tax=Ceratopteris richardii TaxID=49495 RepID=A0A8T2SFU9_CERRI|nr:hypothetical protein KP509_20G008300 [Ceratopteris richardii]